MRWWIVSFLAAAFLGGAPLAPARADVTATQVRQAIQQGVNYLESIQHPDGSWDDFGPYRGGMTALITLALLTCGEPLDEPHVARALESLRAVEPRHTYVVSLQTMVLAKTGVAGDLPLIQRNVDWLAARQVREGQFRGAWSYPLDVMRQMPPMAVPSVGDNSNSQYALLALYEAERAGAQVAPDVWSRTCDYWRGIQNPDGSWAYQLTGTGTGSMTCAGIASLIIAHGAARESDVHVVGDRIQCCVRAKSEEERPIERGLEWLERNFSVSRNPGSTIRGLYYLYGLERVGRLTSHRFIGQHDWYREGAEYLLQIKGDLASTWQATSEGDPRIATAFALLFLAKGRRPIVMAKLKHGPTAEWNPHRSDVANLTDYVGHQWQRDLGWEVIQLESATVDDLRQVPVLYLSGRNSPLPDARQQALAQKLREYFERDGFLLAEANCHGVAFDDGFRKLMKLVFPEPEYALKVLPPEHPIWHAEQPVLASQVRPLMGIEFGCHTCVVFAPIDKEPRPSLSCLWELARTHRNHPLSKKVQDQVDGGLALGINVLAYATNREVKFKDEIPRALKPLARPEKTGRGRLRLANVRHPGGCNAAPRALLGLLESSARELQMRVDLEPQEVGLSEDSLFDYHLIFMHGRHAFQLTEAERNQLKLYVERGGMVLADAICSSAAFTDSFRHEMEAIFPDRPLQPIPPLDLMLTTEYGGYSLESVKRRDLETAEAHGPLTVVVRQVPPQLEGIRIEDRLGVVFSRYDLSCALEKHESLECQGYTTDDAARIGLNVLLYSLQQ